MTLLQRILALFSTGDARRPAARLLTLCLVTLFAVSAAQAKPKITTTSVPNGSLGILYGVTLTATGGPEPYGWSITAGALPTGLTLTAGGTIAGIPLATGTFNFTVEVKDQSNMTDSLALQINISSLLSILTVSLPPATVGLPYSQTLGVGGGLAPLVWSLAGGSLPPGLSLSGGLISGTPNTPGEYSFTVRVIDALSLVATQVLSIIVGSPLTIVSGPLASGTVGVPYSQGLAASGGNGGYAWSMSGGSLPAGLSLSTDGTISGTPTVIGTANFTLQVQDNSGGTATKQLSITIAPPPLIITTGSLAEGTFGVVYQQSLAASGGTGGYSWTVSGGALPAGLSLGADGSITGTPASVGTATFTAQVKDSSNTIATKPLGITVVAPPLNITTGSLSNATFGVAYQQSLAATGGTGGYSWSLGGGSLPAGLSLGADGSISGTPTAVGTATFTAQVKDNSNTTTTKSLSIAVVAPPLNITTASLANGTFGVAYQASLAATGGTGGYSWSLSGGALPAGLSLGADGSISGTPTAVGAATFTVQVKDNSNTTTTKSLGITIVAPPLVITTASLPNGTLGAAYQASLAATGGTGGFSWSLTGGSLPAGLSLGADGGISGTPTAVVAATFTVQVKDSANTTTTKSLGITILAPPLVITTASLPNGTLGAAYQASLAASGGTGGFSWSLSGGSLPAGLSLGADGSISGTPTAVVAATFTVQVKDSANTTTTKSLGIAVVAPPLNITTGSLPNGTVGAAYQASLAATGGTGGFSWSLSGGSLPAGLSLSADGSISGTPTAVAAATFTVQVKDSANTTTTKSLSITVVAPPLNITTGSLPNGTVGAAYQASLAATGGTGGYTWSVTGGSLPAGLSLGGDGSISGTPTAVVAAAFTVQVKDNSNTTATKALAITIGAPPLTITTASLGNGTLGAAYQASLTAGGGTGGFTWSLSGGSLPAGLSLSADGNINGTPSAVGPATFTVQVKDSSNTTTTKSLTITIVAPALTISTSSLSEGTVGTPYHQTLAASGGTGGYTWSITGGSLPTSLSLGTDGNISGTPTTAGAATFTVQVRDSSNTTASKSLSITISAPALNVTTSSLPNGTVGGAYQQTLAAGGGTGGYTWSITGGSLPAGLSLSPDGNIGGTPTAPGASTFTVQVRDSSNATASRSLSITIGGPSLNVTTTSLPNGAVGASYQQTLAASGGSGGYTWSITGGSLPAGLSLGADGNISGTPTAAGASTFTAQVKDSSNATASKSLSITVGAPSLSVTTSSLPNGTVGSGYQQTLAASGGSGGYTWSVTGGSLPAGLSLATNGSIGGTPTAAGASTFTVQVKDSSNATATKSLSITISVPALNVTTASLPNGTVGAAYQQTLVAGGGTGGYTWSVTGGALPAGISLAADGNLGGTPTTSGTSNFSVQVKDNSNATATRSLAIAVAPSSLRIDTSSLPRATVGAVYAQSLSAAGGSGVYAWTVVSGSLPPGLSLSRSGAVGGTPQQPGNFAFGVSVADGGATVNRSLTIEVVPSVSIFVQPLPQGIIGKAYGATIGVSGGSPPYTFTVGTGQLPAGLRLDRASGAISGTPTAAGVSSFRIDVTDSDAGTASASYTITIRENLAISTTATLATGSAGFAYSQTFAAIGGLAPFTWSETGTLPAGLTFAATGVLSGTPTQVGTFPITVQVADASGAKLSGTFSLQVVSGLAIATPPVLPGATAGVPYSYSLQPAGGSAPYSWTVTVGSLPGGLTFSSAGQITGTPTSTGNFAFTAQVTDANSNRAQKAFTLTVAGPLAITNSSLPAGATGTVYAQTLTASGGSPPYAWSVTAGSLPPGLSLDPSSGALTGTPATAGNSTFTVAVKDSNSITVSRQFTLAIGAGITPGTPASLPNATAGSAYSVQLQASGGTLPYSWAIAQGALPAGLSLNGASGLISGTPTEAGTFNFTIRISDAADNSATRNHTLLVGIPPLPAISIGGFSGNLQPLQQPIVDIAIANPYPLPVTGTIALSFRPAGSNQVDDPSVQFSTGGRSATFTIPANATHASFGAPFAVQAGSVAGTISLNVVSVQTAGRTVDLQPAVSATAAVMPGPPVIRSLSLVRTPNGLELRLVGLTATRDLTQASVTFQPVAGTSLQQTTVNVPLGDVANSWFQGSGSAGFGGQFSLTLPFTFQGNVSLSSVSVVLSNSMGDSAASSASY